MTKRKKDKRTNNDLHNIHIKLKIEEHEPQKTGGELRCSGRVSSSCSTSGTRRVICKGNIFIFEIYSSTIIRLHLSQTKVILVRFDNL
jgi:stalled ribosome rescue protein Dom34